MLLFCNDFQATEVLLGIAVAIGGSTTESGEGFVFLTSKPESGGQGVLGALVIADGLQQAEGLAVTVDAISGKQFAGLVDGGSRLVRHVVEIDADITGVTQVLQEMLPDVSPRATVVFPEAEEGAAMRN